MTFAQEILNTVISINERIEDNSSIDTQHVFMETDGVTILVKFLDCTIFNSDDDDRDFDEETGDYILTIEEHLIEEMKDRIERASHIGKALRCPSSEN